MATPTEQTLARSGLWANPVSGNAGFGYGPQGTWGQVAPVGAGPWGNGVGPANGFFGPNTIKPLNNWSDWSGYTTEEGTRTLPPMLNIPGYQPAQNKYGENYWDVTMAGQLGFGESVGNVRYIPKPVKDIQPVLTQAIQEVPISINSGRPGLGQPPVQVTYTNPSVPVTGVSPAFRSFVQPQGSFVNASGFAPGWNGASWGANGAWRNPGFAGSYAGWNGAPVLNGSFATVPARGFPFGNFNRASFVQGRTGPVFVAPGASTLVSQAPATTD